MKYRPNKWEILAASVLSTRTDRYNKGPDGTPPRGSTIRRKAKQLMIASEKKNAALLAEG